MSLIDLLSFNHPKMFKKKQICLIIFFSCQVFSISTEDLHDLTIPQLLKLGQDVSDLSPPKLNLSNIKFYLQTKSDVVGPSLLTSNNITSLDTSKKVKILVHGWIENHHRSWYEKIANEYLKNDNFNIILVDWEKAARMPYEFSAESTKFVGNQLGIFIVNSSAPPDNVHIIGHSLGAHVAGFAGKRYFQETGKKLYRITALDPAGPYFRFFSAVPSERLNKYDAKTVDAIHTDGGHYGYELPIGTLDIYVNGGLRIQPGCLDSLNRSPQPPSFGEMLENSFCSHARSTIYFIEWINQGKFTCKFCPNFFWVFAGQPNQESLRIKDETFTCDEVNENLTGICFANTNNETPFLKRNIQEAN
ncbi:hypothetical protein ABEB36_011551 [Hypothenemus hampei]|uniref:Lipase domain-containing protein n=1 Tax=Hypothenemus hampei TaxID=57062 RepID=A0ABD1E876_HYPHA